MTSTGRIRSIGPFRLETTSDRATAAAAVAAVLLALVIVSPSVGGPAAGDPRRFENDARFARCGGGDAPARYAFEMERARDYREYLPAMPRMSELELDLPALVVVFDGVGPFVTTPTARPGGTPAAVRTAAPGVHDVCVYVGEAGSGQLNYFRDVSIAGLRAVPGGAELEPPASPASS
jgi:hypothetical protein